MFRAAGLYTLIITRYLSTHKQNTMKHRFITVMAAMALIGSITAQVRSTDYSPVRQRTRVEQPAPPTKTNAGVKPLTAPTMARHETVRPSLFSWNPARLDAPAPSRIPGDGTTLHGSLIYSDAWAGSTGNYGIYSFTASSVITPVLEVPVQSYEANGGGTYGDGKYYYNSYVYTPEMGYTFSTFMTYDFATKQWSRITHSFIQETFDQSQITHDMTYDPTTGTVYVICYIKKTVVEGILEKFVPAVGTLDTYTGMVTPIAETPSLIAIAANRAGELYGISKGTESTLYRINKESASCTPIGLTGLNPEYVQSATFDPVTDKLYWAAMEITGRSGLYQVNTTTGAASKIADFTNNEEFTGIYILEPEVNAAAPAAATELTTDFAGSSLSGKIRFTVPSVTYSGTSLSGDISVKIEIDGQKLRDITAQAGSVQSVDVTLAEGLHNFAVTPSNGAGSGPRVAMSWFVGTDAPAAVGDLAVTTADGGATISWTAPVKGINDGYVDPATLAYDVIRMPSGDMVASRTSATSVADPGTFDVQNVYYTVVPYCGDRRGAEASTAEVTVGAGSALPVTFNFETKADFDLCTVIDANEDFDIEYHWGGWMYSPEFPAVAGQETPDKTPANCAVYGYSPENAADDWLIMPPFTAEQGKKYRVTFTMWTRGEKETVSLTHGAVNNAVSQQVIKTYSDYNDKTVKQFVEEFTATASGNYYVGFHMTSPKKRYYLFIDDVTIDEVPDNGAPAAVTGLQAVAGAAGAEQATISFTAPAVNAAGVTLPAIDRIEVYRGNARDAIHVFDTPAPGAQLSWTDEDAVTGFNTYRVVAFNSSGAGEKAEVTVYVGYDLPVAATDVVLMEEDGHPVLRWEAPATGQNGGYVNPSELVYRIIRSDNVMVSNKATGTEFTDNTLDGTAKQHFIYYQIEPVSAAGIGAYALSNHIIFGDPYKGEFTEGFADRAVQNDPWTMYLVKGRSQLWNLYSQGTNPVCAPVDNDGGLATFECTSGFIGDAGRLVSPKLNLAEFDIPQLTFYFYHSSSNNSQYGDDPYQDRMIPEVMLPSGDFVALDEAIFVDDESVYPGWYAYVYDLSAYKAQPYIRLSFHGIADYGQDVNIDHITVTNKIEHDLAMYAFTGPATVKEGKTAKYKATVYNNGAFAENAYKVKLNVNGSQVAVQDGPALQPGKYGTVEFTVPATSAGDSWAVEAVIDLSSDKVPANNISETIETVVAAPDAPEVRELSGIAVDNKVTLSWGSPDALRVAEGFEDYPAFSIDGFGDYTLVDGDGAVTYGFQDIYFENANEPMAFMVFNPGVLGITMLEEWRPRTGQQLLAGFQSYGTANDDWFISPEVHGGTKVSFYAKTAFADFELYGLEQFEVMYSTIDTDPASFRSLSGVVEAPVAWTLYEYTLPASARYFAVHYVSDDHYIFYLDDMSYVARAPMGNLQHTGYRVYRNGVAVADLPATATGWTDSGLADGSYDYKVTALYGSRESGASNVYTAVIGNVGMDNVTDNGPSVRVSGHTVMIDGVGINDAVAITDATGRMLYRGHGSDSYRVDMPCGIYLVAAGRSVVKVAVK